MASAYPVLGYCQDLILNGSFEEYTECPEKANQLHLVNHWNNPSEGSPDYFNECNIFNPYRGKTVDIPDNFIGSQYANAGKGYAGVILYYEDDFYYREYIQSKLKEPLKTGEVYRISLYVSLADSSGYFSDFLSVCLSGKGNLTYEFPLAVLQCECSNKMNIENPLDSVGWQYVSYDYIAQGNESYLTIGIFFDDLSKRRYKKLFVNSKIGTRKYCYYYIDDVSVVPLDQVEKQQDFTHH